MVDKNVVSKLKFVGFKGNENKKHDRQKKTEKTEKGKYMQLMQTFQVKCMAEKYFIQSSYFKPLDIRKSFSSQFGVRYSIKNCIETLKNIHFWEVGNDKTYNMIPIYLAMKMPQKSDWFYMLLVLSHCCMFSIFRGCKDNQGSGCKDERRK